MKTQLMLHKEQFHVVSVADFNGSVATVSQKEEMAFSSTL
jgi:hypothetical protein